MSEAIQVLDHGYVRLVEAWGYGDFGVNEAGIIEAARQSTKGNFRGWEQDEKLLQFMMKNSHATPFEFAGMVIEVRAPIFVFREWHRHRTQSYNEMSARYAPLPNENYMPSTERILMVNDASKNTQERGVAGSGEVSLDTALAFQSMLATHYEDAEATYQWALDHGIAKEVARVCLPVGRYSQMRASANLRNWLGFLTLRMAPNAQAEIRWYANAIGQIIARKFPHTWEAFNHG